MTLKGIANEPDFSWWVPYILRKKDGIIDDVNSFVIKSTHKYGIEIPNSVNNAGYIDKRNGNTCWKYSISKEMSNVFVGLNILEHGNHVPVVWTKSSGHTVFDVKMDLTHKARWVKDGHKHPEPETSSYAGIVSRKIIRTALTYAAINDVEVLADDIFNA